VHFVFFLENVKKEFNMKFKDSVTDWVMPALLLTPHMVLLVAIWIEASDKTEIKSIEIIITLLGIIVGAAGVLVACQALHTWRITLAKSMELDIDLTTEGQVRKIQDLANNYALFVNNDLYHQCLNIKSCKNNNNPTPILTTIPIQNIDPTEIMREAYKLKNLRSTVSVKKRTHPSESDTKDIIELCSILTNTTNRLKYYIKNPVLINDDWNTTPITGLNQKRFSFDIYPYSTIADGEIINELNFICNKCIKELDEKWNS
jgi:hypothetical protein